MNRKVSYVRFQTELYAPGAAGALGSVFPPHNKQMQNLEMVASSLGIHIKALINGEDLELLVPYGNVVLAKLVKEEPKLQSVKKVS